MQLSRKTDYALRTVLDLAMHPHEVVPVNKVADRQGISTNFLEQILLVLKGAGIVASRRGKHGGYYLARRPAEISLAEIIELTEGTLDILSCDGADGCSCPNSGACPIHEVWLDISTYIRKQLQNTSLEQMQERSRELHRESGNPDFVI